MKICGAKKQCVAWVDRSALAETVAATSKQYQNTIVTSGVLYKNTYVDDITLFSKTCQLRNLIHYLNNKEREKNKEEFMLPTANAIKASDLLIEQCHSAYCVINNKSTVYICYLIHSYM